MPYPIRVLTEVLPSRRDVPWWPARKDYQIKVLVIHHAASAEDATPEQINQWHQGRGWPRISYHYALSPSGAVWKCNRAGEITWGAHKHNTPAVHVCLIGDRDRREVPFDQWRSAVELAVQLLKAHPIRLDHIVGHGQLCPPDCPLHGVQCPGQTTACPGRYVSMQRFREDVAAAIGAPA